MNSQSRPLITIIVATYNCAGTLQQCIDSVVQQSYPNKQLIIIDGGSKDGTIGLLRANQEKISYWISEPDRGIYNAWNKGLDQAKGEWICFLGADDYFLDNLVLEHISESLKTLSPEIQVVYGQIMLVDAKGNKLCSIGEPWQDIKERFKQVMCIPHPGVMHRRSLFHHVGQFDESYQIAGDYELLLRELKNNDAYFIPNLISVAMTEGGISSKPVNGLLAMQEIRRAQKLHGDWLPGKIWIKATTRVYVRYLLWRIFGVGLARKAINLYRRTMRLPQ